MKRSTNDTTTQRTTKRLNNEATNEETTKQTRNVTKLNRRTHNFIDFQPFSIICWCFFLIYQKIYEPKGNEPKNKNAEREQGARTSHIDLHSFPTLLSMTCHIFHHLRTSFIRSVAGGRKSSVCVERPTRIPANQQKNVLPCQRAPL